MVAATRLPSRDPETARLSTSGDSPNASVRHFARRFHAECGTTPLEWLLQERGGSPSGCWSRRISRCSASAERAGFGSAIALRRHLARTAGTTPLAYRQAFRGGSGRG